MFSLLLRLLTDTEIIMDDYSDGSSDGGVRVAE